MSDNYFENQVNELLYLLDQEGCFDKKKMIEFFKTIFNTGRADAVRECVDAIYNIIGKEKTQHGIMCLNEAIAAIRSVGEKNKEEKT